MENEIKDVGYNANDMVTQLQNGLWSELTGGIKIDVYRRNLQKAYIERLGQLMSNQPAAPAPPAPATRSSSTTPFSLTQSDIRSIARAHLVKLAGQLKAAAPKHTSDLTRFHIDDSMARIDAILNPTK